MAHGRVRGEVHQISNQRLPEIVGGMRLAREHELDGMIGREQQATQPVGLREQQRRPLVCGEAPGEADGQRLRVEHAVAPLHVRGREPARQARGEQPLPHVPRQPAAAVLARPPQLVVAHIVDALPVARERFGPAGAHVTAEDLGELRSSPGRRVHPVGDRGDRCLRDRHVGPHAGKHLSADRTVQLGDCIGTGGEAQAHHRHVEPFVGLICRGDRAPAACRAKRRIRPPSC